MLGNVGGIQEFKGICTDNSMVVEGTAFCTDDFLHVNWWRLQGYFEGTCNCMGDSIWEAGKSLIEIWCLSSFGMMFLAHVHVGAWFGGSPCDFVAPVV